MEDEVVIIEAEPKMFDIKNEPGKTSFKLDYSKDICIVNQPITRKPEYLAIRDPADVDIELLFRIDQFSSRFERGEIVPEDKPIRVAIPFRAKNQSLTYQIVWCIVR